ncbi:holin [Escherichia phage AV102]|nr:holin [Escherichia phage AV102]
MIKVGDVVGADLATRAGAAVTGATVSGGWLAELRSWDWSVISFITATVCAVLTLAWNAYYKWRTYKLLEEHARKGAIKYEFKD